MPCADTTYRYNIFKKHRILVSIPGSTIPACFYPEPERSLKYKILSTMLRSSLGN